MFIDKINRNGVPEDVLQYPIDLTSKIIANEYEKYDNTNLWGLYITFDKLLHAYYDAGKINYGDIIECQLLDSSLLEFALCPTGTTLKRSNRTGRSAYIIDEHATAEYEKNLLKTLIESGLMTIGHEAPPELLEMLENNVQQGDVISFTDAGSYLCNNRTDRDITLTKCTGDDITKISLTDIRQALNQNKSYTLRFSASNFKELQNFYDEIKSECTGSVIPGLCKDVKNTGSHYIDRLKASLSHTNGRAVKVTLGNDILYVTKNKDKLLWLDKNNTAIDEMEIKLYIACLKSSQLKMQIFDGRDNVSDFAKKCEEFDLHSKIEDCVSKHLYKEEGMIIANFCESKNEEVSVQIKSFLDINSNTEYHARAYLFSKQNGEVKIYEAKYEDDTFESLPVNLVEVTLNDYADFCEKKQSCALDILKVKTGHETMMQWKFDFSNSKTFEAVVTQKAKKQEQPITTANDIKPLQANISALIKAQNSKKSQKERGKLL